MADVTVATSIFYMFYGYSQDRSAVYCICNTERQKTNHIQSPRENSQIPLEILPAGRFEPRTLLL